MEANLTVKALIAPRIFHVAVEVAGINCHRPSS
jgi:hypothetical protein